VSRRIVVSVDPYEARAALMDGDQLVNIEVESASQEKRKGHIYRGRVKTIEPSFEAAFVDYGVGKEGFLPFSDVSDRSLADLTGHARVRSKAGIRVDDIILVQVSKEEVGRKGAVLTMHVSLPGRYVVLMPFDDRTGISRKLNQEERKRLRKVLSRLDMPEGCGVIARTSSESISGMDEVQADLDHLGSIWNGIVKQFSSDKSPGIVHSDAGLAVRFVRDYLSSNVSEILVEDEYSMRELDRYINSCMPGRSNLLKRYDDGIPLFIRYGVERQVDALMRRKVTLPSGGSIVVGETEALVAIDVNSGRFKRKRVEDTAFHTNMEAAKEIARQVVLRDLGGIIVIDFIDMESEQNRHKVEAELKSAMSMDKARLNFGQIQNFGLLAFSRQRIRQKVDSGVMLTCPECAGSGLIRSSSAQSMSTLRHIRERLATHSKKAAYVEVTVPVRIANFLNNRKRAALVGLEKQYGVMIDVTGDDEAQSHEARVNVLPEVPHDRLALLYSDEEVLDPHTDGAPVPIPDTDSTARDNNAESSGLKGFLRMVLGIEDSDKTKTPDADRTTQTKAVRSESRGKQADGRKQQPGQKKDQSKRRTGRRPGSNRGQRPQPKGGKGPSTGGGTNRKQPNRNVKKAGPLPSGKNTQQNKGPERSKDAGPAKTARRR